MSHNTVTINGVSVPMIGHSVDDTDVAAVREWPVFHKFVAGIDPRFQVGGVTVGAVCRVGKERKVLFAYVEAETRYLRNPFYQAAFLRGNSVGILVVLKCEGKRYAVVTRQPRMPTGQFAFSEIPAGTVGAGAFKSTATQELEEELEMTITSDQLFELTDKPLFSSPGGSDEAFVIYGLELEVTAEQFGKLGRRYREHQTGDAGENETITRAIIPLQDLEKSDSAKDVLAYYLYMKRFAA